VSRETVRRWARGGHVSRDNDIRLARELAREALLAIEHSLDQLCRSQDKEHNVVARAALDDVRALLGWTPLKDDEAQHRTRVREALMKIGTRETMASLQAMGDVSCLQARGDN
jgi:hypothetical protein